MATPSNQTNRVWQRKLKRIMDKPQYVVSPRGMEVREMLAEGYHVPMPAFIDLADRNVNVRFMFAEAAWIISGSNRLSDITPYIKTYANFSDDQIFLRGAYGPKVVDQFGYVVDTLEGDRDSRQAVMNIWRERPGVSRDIPCTLSMQFLIRRNKLDCVVTMRSQDIVLGYTYDVFTFSMVANAVRLLLRERGIKVPLGYLHVTAGSLHVYETHYEKANTWMFSEERDESIAKAVNTALLKVDTYEGLIKALKDAADA